MSEVETNAAPAAEGTPAPVANQQASAAIGVASAPAKPLTAIQIVEQQIANFIQQRERAIANVHAIEGALQSAQHLLGVFRAEAAKAEAAAKAALNVVKTDVEKAIEKVESVATDVVVAVENEAKKL